MLPAFSPRLTTIFAPSQGRGVDGSPGGINVPSHPWSQQLLASARGKEAKMVLRLESAEPWGHGGHRWGMSVQMDPASFRQSKKFGTISGKSPTIAW